jgi:rhomboid protease GluP
MIIFINVIIFVLPYIVDFSNGMYDSNTSFLMQFWQDDRAIRQGEWYRLVSSQFLHGNFLHIAFNMYTLWQIKSFLYVMHVMIGILPQYKILTPIIFLFVYLTSGIVGNLASMYFGNGTPSLGASGAILGIFGFMTAYFLFTNNVAQLNNMLINIAILAFMGFVIPNIDNSAHAGGFVSGFGLYYICLAIVNIFK